MADPRPNVFREVIRGGYLSVKQELQRPLPLALAGAAALGWMVVAWFAWSASAQHAEFRRSEAARTELAGELARQRQATGQLADLQAKIATAEQDLTRLNQSVEQAQTQLAARKKGRRSRVR
jgi:uncharacterized protein HemX